MNNKATTIEEERLANLNRARFKSRSKKELFMSGSRIAASAATGGVGRVASREVKRRVSGKISEAGEKAARYYKKRKDPNLTEPPKKLSGAGFWMIFSLSLANEILDVFLNFTLFLSLLTLITGLAITFIIAFYLYGQGVKPSSRKLALWIVSVAIESIPFLNILPTYPVSLLVMKKMENSEFLKKHASVMMAKGIA
ncbi:MAG: hypothetical protein GXP44_01330 [bacterium]|nr:hypothetical protein [bacterium]